MNPLTDLPEIFESLRRDASLIHCITNHISINDCANAILAVGGRPIMAEHPDEVAEITAHAGALVLNLGNISTVRMEAMRRAAQAARQAGVSIVLDPAGVGCSALRRDFVTELLSLAPLAVIRANCSELRALCRGDSTTDGVDAAAGDRITPENARRQAVLVAETARRFHCVVSASGEVDVVSDGHACWFLHNGDPLLGQITGTGCMSSALAGACCAAGSPFAAAIAAAAMMGVCGERAAAQTRALRKGSGTFHTALLDALSTLAPKDWIPDLQLEGATL